MGELTLNLYDRPENFPISRFNGPGLRYCLWVQGCSVRCTGDCLNPEMLSQAERERIGVNSVAEYIATLQHRWKIDGVTFLGGEPFDQAPALAELGRLVKRVGLTVVSYTGRLYEQLLTAGRDDWRALLGVTDILIDGPYVTSEASAFLRWRGSANQRILFLSDAYSAAEVFAQPLEKGANFILRDDGTLRVSGLQDKALLETLMRRLRAGGLLSD
jgi:anaerobic ribonucleoside-triphosphate reductase activating protein